MYLSAENMLAREHLTAAKVSPLSVGRKASALQAEANIVTHADFVARGRRFDLLDWSVLNTVFGLG
jgi:hypothetical protein